MSDVLTIRSYRHDYKVLFTENFAKLLRDTLMAGDVVIIDSNVRTIFAQKIDPIIAHHHVISSKATEDLKSYTGISPIILELIESGFNKKNRLVAIGGGIIQDVTAFIASIFYRGVKWIFLPTNLLSQCDSCIGSKTSINFRNYKNQIGNFYPPQLIISDPQFLNTLEDREIRSGLGEMAHYFLVEDEESFSGFEKDLENAINNRDILKTFIKKSLIIKKKMIEQDEFDEGPRNVFNYGHSFGHAIEGYTNYAIPHGIAVAFGMDIANAQSVRLGLVPEIFRNRVRISLEKIWCSTPFPRIDMAEYLSILRKDKKNTTGAVNVVLTSGFGKMFVGKVTLDDGFVATLEKCFSSFRTSGVKNEN